ncbi:MAG: M12 family metallo-peptidase [Syntrophales bacterium]
MMTGKYDMFASALRLTMQRACLVFFCIVLLGFSAAHAAQFSLIVETGAHQAVMQTQKVEEKPLFRSAARWRRVDLLKQLALPDGIVKGDELVLNLFPDTSYQATVDRVSVNVHGTITVRGRLQNYPLGYVLISTTGNVSLASVRVPELRLEYTIVYDPDSRAHYLLDSDPSKMDKLEDSPAVIPRPPKPEEEQEINALQERVLRDQTANDSTATIDVMVVYTPAARQWAVANEGSITNTIAQAMEKGQLVADNSGTHFSVQLVHSAEVTYTESGNSEIDLYRLQQSGDGYLDTVHALRNIYAADLVVLFTKMEDTGGIGYLLDSAAGEPAYGFSITRVQQASWTYTTIHEIGHNMGMGHHKAQNFQAGPGLSSYSAGWRWTSTDRGLYCSVMTYEDGSYFSDGINHMRVAYFSNPAISYLGTSTGNATNGDNARTARETKAVIAAYRQLAPSCTSTLSPTSALFNSSGNTGTVTVTTSSGGCSWSAVSNTVWITITAGGSGTGNGTVSYSVSANTTGSSRTGTMTIGGQTFIVTQSANTVIKLYFPHVETSLPWQTEIAIINTSSSQSVTGTLKAYNDNGDLIETKPAIPLPPRSRREIIVSSEFADHVNIGYIIFESNSNALQGYTKFIEGINRYRAAIPATKEVNTSQEIYISHIASDAKWWTGLSLVNTTPATRELTITFDNAEFRRITLTAGQHRVVDIARDFFNNQPRPDIHSAVIANAAGIIGLELFGSTVGGNQMDGIPLTGNTASTIYYPHIASDGWWTGIVAYNTSASGGTLTITFSDADGGVLATQILPIGGKGKYIGTAADLGFPAQAAWFKISSTTPLSGFELFGTADNNRLAAYAGGNGSGTAAGVFPKIEKDGWTGLAFVNVDTEPASVTLNAYTDAGGTAVATRVLTVRGHAKVVGLAKELFSPQDIGTATYITYSSTRNIVGFQLNGTKDGTMLDGLPGLAATN